AAHHKRFQVGARAINRRSVAGATRPYDHHISHGKDQCSIAVMQPRIDALPSSWVTRNIIGMTFTSFCADVGYEMVGAVLPGFLAAIGVSAAALGWIEGAADAASSFLKLGSGWYGDRIGRRKPIVALGYFLSGTMLAWFAAARSWRLILAGRVTAW